MSTTRTTLGVAALVLALVATPAIAEQGETLPAEIGERIALPAPDKDGDARLDHSLRVRRSVRAFASAAVTKKQLSQLLWSAQGVTDRAGHRTVPSAGASYPFEIYLAVERVEGLEPGLYHYRVGEHTLALVKAGSQAEALELAAVSQRPVGQAAVSLVLVGVVPRTAERYGERAERYVWIEAGGIAQAVSLQAAALGLGTVWVGAFDDADVQALVGTDAAPALILPVGHPVEGS